MTLAKISSKGQISLPKEVRDALGLQAGDRVGIHVEDGRATLVPVHTRRAEDLLGVFRTDKPLPDLSVLREAHAAELAAKYGTGRRE